MEGRSQKGLAQSANSEEIIKSVKHFFCDIWRQPHEYVVFVARRCFNLNEVFMRVCATQNEPINSERFMSDMALLQQADVLAQYYIKNQRFPRILICDDLILYGRGITRLLYQLEVLIAEQLGDISGYSRYDVHRHLVRAVDIYVFARNRNRIILDADYQTKIKAVREKLYPSELRALSHYLSVYLQETGEPYTSYVFSLMLKPPKRVKHWQTVLWDYNEYFSRVFVKEDSGFTNTVRFRFPQKTSGESYVAATALPLLGDVKCRDFAHICEGVTTVLRSQECLLKSVIEILENNNDLLQKLRGQLVTFICSVVSMRDFLAQMSQEELKDFTAFLHTDAQLYSNNISKIASNFGPRGVMEKEMTQLVKLLLGLRGKEICDAITALFAEKNWFATDCSSPEVIRISDTAMQRISETAEDILYAVGMNGERESYLVRRNERWFYPTRMGADMIRLEEYIEKLSIQSGYPEREYRVAHIASIFSLMDSGYLALKLEADKDTGDVQCVLKAGEPSLFIIPQRYADFMPALEYLEQNQWRLEISKSEAVSQFIVGLTAETFDKKYQSKLVKLKQNIRAFCGEVYASGQSFTGWNSSIESLNYGTKDEGDAFQSYCKECANRFIEKYAVI